MVAHSVQTYRGTCHCGRITFEVGAELSTGEADLVLYQFNTRTAKPRRRRSFVPQGAIVRWAELGSDGQGDP